MTFQRTHLLTHTYFSIHFPFSPPLIAWLHSSSPFERVFKNMTPPPKKKAALHNQRLNNPLSIFLIPLHALTRDSQRWWIVKGSGEDVSFPMALRLRVFRGCLHSKSCDPLLHSPRSRAGQRSFAKKFNKIK